MPFQLGHVQCSRKPRCFTSLSVDVRNWSTVDWKQRSCSTFYDGLPGSTHSALYSSMRKNSAPTDVRDGLAFTCDDSSASFFTCKVCDADEIVICDDLGRYLVQEIVSLVGDIIVRYGRPYASALSVTSSLGKRDFLVQGHALTRRGRDYAVQRRKLFSGTEVTVIL